MYKTRGFSNVTSIDIFKKYRHLVLTLVSLIVLTLMSHSSYALAPNPGAVCPAGFSQDKLTNNDYTNLLANTNNYFDIAGNAAGSIPLQMRMNLNESNANNTNNNFSIIDVSQYRLINIGRNFPTPTAYTDITLSFRNKITEQPIYLTNVAISAFDIDYSNSRNSSFDDYVRITGITESNSVIDGTLQTIAESLVVYSEGLNNSTAFNCSSRNLDTLCQGSIQFSEAVSTVTIRYTNNPIYVRDNPTSQEIQFQVDNYCYVPQYIFSGTVFDDNGGITGNNADATNANITTGPYANNNSYFNGAFNPPQETGIAGSTVRLANCADTSTTYPTQSVIGNNPPIGEYQISIPKTTLANNTNLCLIESSTNTTYPIRTTSENINTGFSTTKYNYPNNDFGRVIAENVALVLKKYQYINDCPATLNYTAISETATPNTGFSTASIEDIEPGNCIAYKITATNRANMQIDSFIMRDVLQKKGINNATVTSVLASPALSTVDYTAAENPAIGDNGEIKTKTLSLAARAKRDFYFNSKYGTTVNAQ